MASATSTADRFWAQVEKTNTCWLWRGSLHNLGYGRFYLEAHLQFAHRVALELVGRPCPDGLEVDHLCRVRNCVNPDHLEYVTHRENQLRGTGWPAENAAKTHCKRGHELTGWNLILQPGGRKCRECQYMVSRRAAARRKERARQSPST